MLLLRSRMLSRGGEVVGLKIFLCIRLGCMFKMCLYLAISFLQFLLVCFWIIFLIWILASLAMLLSFSIQSSSVNVGDGGDGICTCL